MSKNVVENIKGSKNKVQQGEGTDNTVRNIEGDDNSIVQGTTKPTNWAKISAIVAIIALIVAIIVNRTSLYDWIKSLFQ